MTSHDRGLHLLALCALEGVTGKQWQVIARQARRHKGLERLLAGSVDESTASASTLKRKLGDGLDRLDDALVQTREVLSQAAEVDAQLVTVMDDAYPTNLREIYNLPPFLFVQGTLLDDDITSVAVVGTRSASDLGLQQAGKLARQLSERGVTVVSGMAAGIDTAAHEATLDVGGRTIAVMGTGVLRTYPEENEDLRARIIESGGAVLSQFWPTTPPSRKTFPIRNVVTSGISQGTVVIEASSTSGAKMQARLAYEHGKRVFVLRQLATDQPWARSYVDAGKAVEVEEVDDVVDLLRSVNEVQDAASFSEQLALELA